MKRTTANFTFDNLPCRAVAENNKLTWIELDGHVGPANQWSVQLRLAAIEALKLI